MLKGCVRIVSLTGARGDQCDECGKLLDPLSLKNPKINPKMFHGQENVVAADAALEVRESEHFYLKLSAFQGQLEQRVASVE